MHAEEKNIRGDPHPQVSGWTGQFTVPTIAASHFFPYTDMFVRPWSPLVSIQLESFMTVGFPSLVIALLRPSYVRMGVRHECPPLKAPDVDELSHDAECRSDSERQPPEEGPGAVAA